MVNGRPSAFVVSFAVFPLAVAACGGGHKTSAAAFPSAKDCSEYAQTTADVGAAALLAPAKMIQEVKQFYDDGAKNAPPGVRGAFATEARFFDDLAAASKGANVGSNPNALDVITRRLLKMGVTLRSLDKSAVSAKVGTAWVQAHCPPHHTG
jgi:hypothetical protein